MKTILVSFLALVAAGGAFAGERVVATDRTARYSEGKCDRTRKTRNAGDSRAHYRSNFFHNAIMLINDTPDYMTFFVYSGDVCGPNDINGFIRRGAHVPDVSAALRAEFHRRAGAPLLGRFEAGQMGH